MRTYADALTAEYHDAGVWRDRTWSSYVADNAASCGNHDAVVDQPYKQELMGRARFKIPEVEVVEELPKGPSGKFLKRSLRDRSTTQEIG